MRPWMVLGAAIAFMAFRKRPVTAATVPVPSNGAVRLDPVRVTAYAPEKPISMPTSFQYQEMPEPLPPMTAPQPDFWDTFRNLILKSPEDRCRERGGSWNPLTHTCRETGI